MSADKKLELIVEFGSAYTKVGYSMDNQPKRVLRINLLKNISKNRLNNELYIEECLYALFNIEVAANLRGRSIILIYNYYCIEDFVNILAQVLFYKFEVSKIAFVVGNVLPLYLSGHFTGIVVDLGYWQSTATAVYDGYSLMHLGGYIGEGGRHASARVQKLFQDPAAFEFLEDVAAKHGRILSRGEPESNTVVRVKLTSISEYALSKCYTETYFGNWEEEESNVAYGLLKMIAGLKDVDIISKCCQNIILCGGGRLLNNFQARFRAELLEFLAKEFAHLSRYQMYITQNTQRHQQWVGGSVLAQVSGHERFQITSQKFKENGNLFLLRSDAYNFIGVK